MLNLICKIEIRNKVTKKTVTFDYVSNVEVKTSCKTLTDTATVKFPRKAEWSEKPLLDYIHRGSEITIRLGYEQYGLQTVFEGYVTAIEDAFPIVLTCQNEMWKLKLMSIKDEWAKKVGVSDLESFIKDNTGITPIVGKDIQFGSIDLNPDTIVTEAFDKIMKAANVVKVFFHEGKLYVVNDLETAFDKREKHKFSPERNMINRDKLNYLREDDVKKGVRVISTLDDNTLFEACAPAKAYENGNIKSGYKQEPPLYPNCKTQQELQAYADSIAAEYASAKMTGFFTAFGVPFVRKGDIVELIDDKRLEGKNNKFIVDGVDYNFGTTGYVQTITLGNQIKQEEK